MKEKQSKGVRQNKTGSKSGIQREVLLPQTILATSPFLVIAKMNQSFMLPYSALRLLVLVIE